MGYTRSLVQNNRNIMIDTLRIIMAIFVIGIHCAHGFSFFEGWFQPLNALNASIFRIAVPFFLLVSSYFANQRRTPGSLFKTSVRYAALYCVWTILYMPIIVYQQFMPSLSDPLTASLRFIQRFAFEGSITLLWYLLGGAVGFSVAALVRLIRIPGWATLMLSFFAFCIGAFGDSYYGFLSATIAGWYDAYLIIGLTTRNGLFFCWFFVELGSCLEFFLSKCKPTRKKRIVCVSALIISVLTLVVEGLLITHFSIPRDMNFLFSTIIAAPALLILALWLPPFLKTPPISLGPVASFMYLLQVYALAAYKVAFGSMNVMQNEYIKMATLAVVLFLLSIALTFLANKIKKPWVRWLY